MCSCLLVYSLLIISFKCFNARFENVFAIHRQIFYLLQSIYLFFSKIRWHLIWCAKHHSCNCEQHFLILLHQILFKYHQIILSFIVDEAGDQAGVEGIKVAKDLVEPRRFSETVAIDNSQTSENALKLDLPKKTKSEVLLRSVSLPRGMSMKVELDSPLSVTDKKQINLKQSVEAISTMRQEMMIPLIQNRSFSETVAIDNSKQEEMLLQLRQFNKAQLSVERQSAPRPVKVEVEISHPTKELSHCEYQRKRRVEVIQTQRQEMKLQIEGGEPVFLDELVSHKVMDGEQVKFQCHVKGNPMPEITWKHNGKIVFDNPDVRTVYKKEIGEATLLILEAFPQDTGVYECIAVNKYGKASTVAHLNVEGMANFCIVTS